MNSSVVLKDRHYTLDLPFRKENQVLPNNRPVAEQRLIDLKKQFQRHEQFKKEYSDFITDIIGKGYAEVVPSEQLEKADGRVWYIPHRGVYHPRKKTLRVVFDCSTTYQGTSLNLELLQGPDLTNSLVGVLFRFRLEPVAVMADIRSMFHQVMVSAKDVDFLRFLWWPDGDMAQTVVEHRMLEAVQLVKDLSAACEMGGFQITKWASNSRTVLSAIPQEDRAKDVKMLDLEKDELPMERGLGLQWCIENDTFMFKIALRHRPLTRRGLSVVSSVYDPLGFLAPVMLPVKHVLQQLCKEKYGWDEPIPATASKKWMEWTSSLEKLSDFSVAR
ncbi:hypothetical protein ACEWY4_020609 [Coilia grayii]|uniref:Uncharacterized protein n=1 Tax=Coilia grayii TaxID=363190 RepID=A0ABD1J9V8_9TELE